MPVNLCDAKNQSCFSNATNTTLELNWFQSIVARCRRGLEESGIETNNMGGEAATVICSLSGLTSPLTYFQRQKPETIAFPAGDTFQMEASPDVLVMGFSRGLHTGIGSRPGLGNSPATVAGGGGISATQIGLMFSAMVMILDQIYGADFESALDRRIESIKLYISGEWERQVDPSLTPIVDITKEQQEIIDKIKRGEGLTALESEALREGLAAQADWVAEIIADENLRVSLLALYRAVTEFDTREQLLAALETMALEHPDQITDEDIGILFSTMEGEPKESFERLWQVTLSLIEYAKASRQVDRLLKHDNPRVRFFATSYLHRSHAQISWTI